jgi:DNA-binding NarL/FixJ family response regulator
LSQDQNQGRAGYVLIVGRAGPDRSATEQALLASGLEAAAATEADVLVVNDLMPPTLVILDDASSKDERAATLRRLQAHPALQGVPILILAYDSDIDSYSTAITKGAAAYLVKPAATEEMIDVIRKLSGWVATDHNTEKRRRVRRPLIMRVDVDVRSRKVKVPGHLMDVSGGGCRLEVAEAIAAGEAIRVILHGYDASTYVALGAEVRWHKEVSPGVHLVGARFTGTTALLAGKLLGFVSSGMT